MAQIRVMSNAQRAVFRSPSKRDSVALGPVVSTVTIVEDHITVSVVPVITAGAYAIGRAVGGLLTFTNATLGADRQAVIKSCALIDLGQQEAALDLVLFDRTFTATADNVAFDPTDADLANYIGMLHILPEHYTRFVDNSVAILRDIALYCTSALDGNLYGQLVVRGMPTYASVSDLRLRLTTKRD